MTGIKTPTDQLPDTPENPVVKLPVFVKILIIADLVFCFILIPKILIALQTLQAAGPDTPLYSAVFLEMITNILLVPIGLAGNILILLKKKIGAYISIGNIVLMIILLGCGIYSSVITIEQYGQEKFELTFLFIGLFFGIFVRVGYFGFYTAAVVKAYRVITQPVEKEPVLKESKHSENYYKQAAKASWIIPLITLGIMIFMNSYLEKATSAIPVLVVSIIVFSFYIVGIVSGSVALFGIKLYGPKGILAPSIIGILVNLAFFVILFFIAYASMANYLA